MTSPYPIELQAPDLSRWAGGNTGTPYVWRFDSGQPGPQVMVQALTHGNEICGAIALDWLLDSQSLWQPQRGSLTLAFGNIAAFARWDPADPDRSRFVDEDFNRVWADDTLFGHAIRSSCAARASCAPSSMPPSCCWTCIRWASRAGR